MKNKQQARLKCPYSYDVIDCTVSNYNLICSVFSQIKTIDSLHTKLTKIKKPGRLVSFYVNILVTSFSLSELNDNN